MHSVPDVHYKYFMVVSPLDGRLYVTDQQNLRIIRVKTMGAVRELTHNYEVVAGTGRQCVPGDDDRCGDEGPATGASLFYPKGNQRDVSRCSKDHHHHHLFRSSKQTDSENKVT